jgi:DNA polymerase III subunit delta'
MLLETEFEQHAAFNHLQNAFLQGTLSTSYLFSGARGLGKRELAFNFARLVNCQGEIFQFACTCNACHKVQENIHPDVRLLGDDLEERSIKIKEVREMQTWLHFKPYEGKYKVLIIRDADRMTADAQNAFLKTLEEPPARSLIVLTVTNPLLLLPTILSRVTEIRLKPLTRQAVKERLVREYGFDEGCDFVAYLAGGSFEHARAIVDQGILDERNKVMEHFCEHKMFEYLKAFEAGSYKGLQDKVSTLLDILSFIVRDLLVLAGGESETLHQDILINTDHVHELLVIAEHCDPAELVVVLDDLRELKVYIDNNVNVKMIVTSLMVLLSKVMK